MTMAKKQRRRRWQIENWKWKYEHWFILCERYRTGGQWMNQRLNDMIRWNDRPWIRCDYGWPAKSLNGKSFARSTLETELVDKLGLMAIISFLLNGVQVINLLINCWQTMGKSIKHFRTRLSLAHWTIVKMPDRSERLIVLLLANQLANILKWFFFVLFFVANFRVIWLSK